MTPRFLPGLLITLGVLALGLFVAFTVGRYPVTLAELIEVLVSRLMGRTAAVSPAVENVVLLVRGPRVVAAVLVGGALAVAGTAFQGLFRNPLVSPDILGASSGAALGAVLGIYFSLGVIGIEGLAFAGGLVAVAAVYIIGSLLHSRDPILVLVLTGVVVGALLGAGVGLVKYLADPYNQLPAMTFWLLGSLAATTVADLLPLIGPVAAGTIVLIALRWRLNVMSLPEDEARALGLATGPFRIVIVAAATLVTSASVATSGIIGWVGLVVPHLARALVGPDFPRLIPTAALLGGGYLLFIDTLARTAAPVEIPLGILTAVIGTPFFIWLLAGMQRTWS
ncbi:MAG: iron ABC transporter permease [Hyphomicrobiales bacterium]|nr:iron ABC transporter permease [Hyphomicrobiales bacterium]